MSLLLLRKWLAMFYILCLLLLLVSFVMFSPFSCHIHIGSSQIVHTDVFNNFSLTTGVAVSPGMVPFVTGQPHQLLILSYQRCGSSFFGDIFGKNNKVFFVYEPLDALYVSLYGTKPGWNVPSDIRNYANGSMRPLPEFEVKSVSNLLNHILNCNPEEFPLEFLTHKFFGMFREHQKAINSFIGCTERRRKLTKGTCWDKFEGSCKKNFEADGKNFTQCHERKTYMRSLNDEQLKNIPIDPFVKYELCVRDLDREKNNCKKIFKDTCSKNKLRVIKTVRASMESVEELISKNPNLRVIHLIRDPRPVVLSRRKFDRSGYGKYAVTKDGMDIIKEATLYCRDVVNDVRLRQKLEQQYPEVFLQIIYDEFVLDPVNNSKKLYEFMNITFPIGIKKWLETNSEGSGNTGKNSAAIARKWQSQLTYLQAKRIEEECMELFNLIETEWVR